MFKIALISGLCTAAAFGQTLPPKDVTFQKQTIGIRTDSSFGPIGITAALAGPESSIPGAPYSAQAVTQSVQTLADGTHITQTTTNSVARDSKGRVYREESLAGLGNAGPEPPRLVLIEDPVAGVHITLDSNSKTAIKMGPPHIKRMDEAAAHGGLPAQGETALVFSTGPGTEFQMATSAMKTIDEGKTTKTELGTQNVGGVMAKGAKVSHTIPAGEIGNDMPLVITTETWYSPELKLLVMSKSSDPRMGETTYKLTNISRAEPDPGLFQIPADYTVKDQPGEVMIFRKVDK